MTQYDDCHIFYSSLTRIADLTHRHFEVIPLERSRWRTGDYVMGRVTDPGTLPIELANGRMAPVMRGDLIIGALGVRHATLELTGTWKAVDDDLQMHALTGAGLFGKMTSTSPFVADVVCVGYAGHVMLDDRQANMLQYLPDVKEQHFTTPTVLFTGTSMSSGKTTSARVITQIFKNRGMRVLGAKLTGAGRYRDILAMQDAGAHAVFDFVDVGLPSTVVEPELYAERLNILLSIMQGAKCDVAVIEIGASPLEPYNGEIAINRIADNVFCKILCALDPYSVLGVMRSFDITPDIVAGPATNTLGGLDLIRRLCHVRGINIIDPDNHERISQIVFDKLRSSGL